MAIPPAELRRYFGDLDIYLFDQLLKERIAPGARILDAGCGSGRNMVYLLRAGFDLWAIDENEGAVETTRNLAAELVPHRPRDRVATSPVERMPFGDAMFDVVISSAVLHFARDEAHWAAMVREMWRVLAPGGLLFARLASTVGHESRVTPRGNRRYLVPDGSERFLVDEAYLMDATATLGGRLMDPIKTTVVQGMRSMTTWVLRK